MKRDFLFVRCADKKTAGEVKAGSPPEIIVFHPDGEEIYRQNVRDAVSVERAMTEALKIYGPKEITWTAYDESAWGSARECGKLVVLVFASESHDSEATLKALEDRTLAKMHESVLFLRTTFVKDGPVEKSWGVMSAPTILLADPTKEAGSKAVLDRSSGKKSAGSLKSMLSKALKAVEK